ncbi:MAG TPA: hypothetical protein VFI41_04615 [Gemmatimonadales bacterium]|nr:hypothetical protein [Gemmatimonadales bacterium]
MGDDNKYIVFNRKEFMAEGMAPEIEDAVVIRRQDIFAPPALDAYANAIQTCVEVLTNGTQPTGRAAMLQEIADYFHTQAQKSWAEQRKLPD